MVEYLEVFAEVISEWETEVVKDKAEVEDVEVEMQVVSQED